MTNPQFILNGSIDIFNEEKSAPPDSNYWAMKAYFAAVDLERIQAKIALAYRRKEFEQAQLLEGEHDELVRDVRLFDARARQSLNY